jgi:hypothetical protein
MIGRLNNDLPGVRTGPSGPQGEILMKRFAIFAMMFVSPIAVFALEKDAKTVAQDVLDKGAALFDTRDAAAMAATYTEDAQLLWIDKDSTTGEIKITVKKDRTEIESLYHDLWKDAKEKTTSKNTVEFARFVGSELMVVHGVFQPNVDKDGKFPFVQMRIKQGEKWLIKNLQLYVISSD